MEMQRGNYPGLHNSASNASKMSQDAYFRLQGWYLRSLIAGGIAGASISLVPGPALKWVFAAIAFILVVGLLILWITRSRQDDKTWFDCRAVAESVKTASWRFMMRIPPFQSDATCENNFLTLLKEIREARPIFRRQLAMGLISDTASISDFMRRARVLSFDEKKSFYVEQRLRDQKKYYSSNAQINSKKSSRWFWTIVSLQFLAVAAAIVQATLGGLGTNFVPVITTCAAVAVAWSQMKRHDELFMTYSVAAQELLDFETIAEKVDSESKFAQLVEQVEGTISREHTMWCAKRDVKIERIHPSGARRGLQL